MAYVRGGKGVEILGHSDLKDMPDVAGTNADHDQRYVISGIAASDYVPYMGAVKDVNLGTYDLAVSQVTIKSGSKLILDG